MTYKGDKKNFIGIRLTDSQLSKLDILANSRKMSRVDILRDIIDYYFRTFHVEEVDND